MKCEICKENPVRFEGAVWCESCLRDYKESMRG